MRFRCIGWMSAVHWNGSEFRVGESGDGASVDVEDPELVEAMHSVRMEAIQLDFGEMVLDIERICKPRMVIRKERIAAEKVAALQKSFEAAQSLAQ